MGGSGIVKPERADRVRDVSRGHLAAEATLYAGVAGSLLAQYLPLLTAQDVAGTYGPGGFVEQIAQGHGEDPYRHRLLIPGVLWLASRATGIGLWPLHVALFAVAFFGILAGVRWMLTGFGFARGWAVAGALLVGALLPVALRNHFYQPWSWLEVVFLAVAVGMVLRRASWSVFALLVGVAALNRETALFLPLLPVAMVLARRDGPAGEYWRMAGWGFVAVLGVRLGLMVGWPGPAMVRAIGLDEVLARNVGSLGLTARNVLLLLGAVGVLAVVALVRRSASREAVWIMVLGVPPLLAIYLVFAVWVEVRVLVPVLVLLLPVALSVVDGQSMMPPRRRASGVRSSAATGAADQPE